MPPARQAPLPAPPTDPGSEFIEKPEPFDVNMDPGQRTALHLAIAHKHHEVVKVMLQYKGEYIIIIIIIIIIINVMHRY